MGRKAWVGPGPRLVCAALAAAVMLTGGRAVATPDVSADPEAWTFKWSDGFKLERNDGAFKLKFGGRIQNDWAVIEPDSDLRAAGFDKGNGTEFRRARLFFAGTVYEQLFFKAQYDFANTGDGKADFKDVYMGLRDIGPVDRILVGHFKEPFGLNQLTSSKYITFMERSLPVAFEAARNTGLMLQSTELDKRLLWQVGGFRNSNDQGFSFGDDNDYNLTTRLVGVPYYEDGGARVLHLGFSYSHQFRQGFDLRYRQRPDSHLADRIVDTRNAITGLDIPTDDIDLIGPEVALVWGPASFQAEYIASFVNGKAGNSDTDFWGGYVEASYFLTGEHRNYELGRGHFGRLSPKENFSTRRGTWGAWQIAARFSYLDLNDEIVKGGKVWDLTAALNWYPFPNARVMLNYIHSRVEDRLTAVDPGLDGDADIAQVRFQVDF